MTQDEAKAGAAVIRKFWAAKGHHVKVRAERDKGGAYSQDHRAVFCIRSDLVNGQPRKGA